MKICIIGHPYISSTNQEKFSPFKKISKDVEILLISPTDWHIPSFPSVKLYTENKEIKIVSLPTMFVGHGGLYFFRSFKLISIIKIFQPDIIQVDQEPHSLIYIQTVIAQKIAFPKAKLIFFSWNNLPNLRSFPKNVGVELLLRIGLKYSDGAVCGNPDGAKLLKKTGFNKPIEVIPQFGIDSSIYQKINVDEIKKKLGIESSFVIGYIGRIIREKGLNTLFESLSGLKMHNWKLLLVGRGEMLMELLSYAHSHGFKERIVIVDNAFWYDIVPYLNCMDVMVLPSVTVRNWKEQFGRVLIEAMSCGIPVIGSDSGAIPWVIGDAGLVFPEGNVDKLKANILNLIQQNFLRQKLIQLGKQRVEKEFTKEKIAAKYLDFYSKLLKN